MQHKLNSRPRPRQRHHSFDEAANEPASLLEHESTDIEAERPAEENEPIESAAPTDRSPAAFEQE